MKKYIFSIVATLVLMATGLTSLFAQLLPKSENQLINVSPVVEQQSAIVQTDSTIGVIDLRRLDFSTPQKAKDTTVWLFTTLFALAFGYIPAVQKWAASVKNIKGLRIAGALVPVVVVGLLFGFNGDILKLLSDAILSILLAGGIAGQLINPLMKASATVESEA
ncbi:MAG: hypothetical protein U5L45_00380 [Saprospiraceae bacterium]|nr:hypothetical protein [Saprospiraceae bacterium]